ncbi:MAG TPA: zinc-ribbon domain-containing protein [Acidimicrobiales bacterium]
MFIIFGFKRKPYRLATILALCAVCQATAAQDLSSVRTFFRLFFVPLVPWPTSYQTSCRTCTTATTVSAEQADRLLASAPHVDDHAEPEAELASAPAAA